jgi:hypothetical protein
MIIKFIHAIYGDNVLTNFLLDIGTCLAKSHVTGKPLDYVLTIVGEKPGKNLTACLYKKISNRIVVLTHPEPSFNYNEFITKNVTIPTLDYYADVKKPGFTSSIKNYIIVTSKIPYVHPKMLIFCPTNKADLPIYEEMGEFLDHVKDEYVFNFFMSRKFTKS